ncbi:MAG: DUF4862 family protein [Corynebacterium sp.]|nr:DUF4862 family protein [Corynebacterium sp.]
MSKFIVGAYASQPDNDAGQRAYYDALAATGWVDGLEVPYPGQFDRPEFLGELLADRFTSSVLTAIPGTMVNVWDAPSFGLGSPDEAGRSAALEFTQELYQDVQRVHEIAGHSVFSWVALHSAPTQHSTPEAFARSLSEVLSWDWGSTSLTIEHCDERSTNHTPEKGFLPLEEELAVARELGIGVSLNWGRSAVGSRGDVAPLAHVEQAAKAGKLVGVIFSGASPQETIYGPEWIDGHLPLSTDEPASLMTPNHVSQAAAAAASVAYLGAKCCVPPEASLERRVRMIRNIYQACSTTSVA